jgi:hypothetical protein
MSEDLGSVGAFFAVNVLGEALLKSEDCVAAGQWVQTEEGGGEVTKKDLVEHPVLMRRGGEALRVGRWVLQILEIRR